MKTKPIMILAVIMILSSGIFAQGNLDKQRPNKGDGPFMNIPDLTEDQTNQITDLRTAHMKEVMPIHNEIKEKEAKLNTISTGDNVDINKVNGLIDEIGALKITLAKKREAFKQDVRKILTDDQRVYFDMHSPKMHKQKGMMHNPNCMQK